MEASEAHVGLFKYRESLDFTTVEVSDDLADLLRYHESL